MVMWGYFTQTIITLTFSHVFDVTSNCWKCCALAHFMNKKEQIRKSIFKIFKNYNCCQKKKNVYNIQNDPK